MEQSEVIEFAKYEVYEYVGEDKKQYHCICLCNDIDIAIGIAKTLARLDPSCDEYYVSNVSVPNTFVIGGGWYECYWKDKETGKLKHCSLE